MSRDPFTPDPNAPHDPLMDVAWVRFLPLILFVLIAGVAVFALRPKPLDMAYQRIELVEPETKQESARFDRAEGEDPLPSISAGTYRHEDVGENGVQLISELSLPEGLGQGEHAAMPFEFTLTLTHERKPLLGNPTLSTRRFSAKGAAYQQGRMLILDVAYQDPPFMLEHDRTMLKSIAPNTFVATGVNDKAETVYRKVVR